jgi:hypothetical protein
LCRVFSNVASIKLRAPSPPRRANMQRTRCESYSLRMDSPLATSVHPPYKVVAKRETESTYASNLLIDRSIPLCRRPDCLDKTESGR